MFVLGMGKMQYYDFTNTVSRSTEYGITFFVNVKGCSTLTVTKGSTSGYGGNYQIEGITESSFTPIVIASEGFSKAYTTIPVDVTNYDYILGSFFCLPTIAYSLQVS